MGKRLFATVLVGVGLSLGLAGTAVAAPSNPDVSVNAVWYNVGTFRTLAECNTVGEAYVVTGRAKAWTCVPTMETGRPWLLRVLD